MPIVEGTQPSPVHVTGGATTGTTNAFIPESGALLVLLVAADGANVTSATTVVVTDSLGGTWTLLKRQNTFVQGPPDVGGSAEVWVRDSPGVSMTVTGTWTSTNGGPDGNIVVRTLLGALPVARQAGATAGSGGASIAPSVALTPTQIGSRIYGAGLRWVDNATLTPNANTVDIDQFNDAGVGDTWTTFKSNADTTSLTSTTYGYTNANNEHNVAAAEILAAPSGGAAPQILPPWLLFELVAQAQQQWAGDAASGTPTVAEGGVCALGLAATGTAVHVGNLSGTSALGLAGTGTAKKVVALGGTCALGLAGSGVAAKKAPQAGPATLGLAGAAADRKVAVERGTAALGLAAAAADTKRAPQAGLAALGLAGTRTSGPPVRAVAGVGYLGLAASGVAARVARAAGIATVGVAGTAGQRKTGRPAGTAALGVAGSSTQRHVAKPAGTTALGLAAVGAAVKRAVSRGLAVLGLAPSGSATRGSGQVEAGALAVTGDRLAASVAGDTTGQTVTGDRLPPTVT